MKRTGFSTGICNGKEKLLSNGNVFITVKELGK
jgi:hypothetical protein